ncbi:MAG: DUF6545 domain-containing protein [Beutenbergiaceae bacterium]
MLVLCCSSSATGDPATSVAKERIRVPARWQLRRLRPLWTRMIELASTDLHLAVENLSTAAKVQRACVEISDAICSLRMPPGLGRDFTELALALRRGIVSSDEQAPLLSDLLPPRKHPREDLAVIHSLARECREQTRRGLGPRPGTCTGPCWVLAGLACRCRGSVRGSRGRGRGHRGCVGESWPQGVRRGGARPGRRGGGRRRRAWW